MTALQLSTGGFGYGPARAARIESERAMRRALPASFLFVTTGLLLMLALTQRFGSPPPIRADLGRVNDHLMVGWVEERLPANPAALRLAPSIARPGRVPLPVPDIIAPRAELDGGGNAHAAAGPAIHEAGGMGSDGASGAVELDPLPGAFVYTDQLPARASVVAPEYPDLAREAGVEGTVMLWALVDLDGSVKAVQVIRSVPLLDAAASAALLRWRFTPALANGHPVRVWVAVPVKFSLQ